MPAGPAGGDIHLCPCAKWPGEIPQRFIGTQFPGLIVLLLGCMHPCIRLKASALYTNARLLLSPGREGSVQADNKIDAGGGLHIGGFPGRPFDHHTGNRIGAHFLAGVDADNLLGVGFCSSLIAQVSRREPRAAAGVHGHAPPQVGQGKGGSSVSAIRRSHYGKQGLVFVDFQQAAVTESPIAWGKVAGKHNDGTNKCFVHD